MKFSFSLLTLFSGNILVNAFPALNPSHLEGLTPEKLDAAIRSVNELKQSKRFLVDVNKPIDITGKHAFRAPKGKDQRGPCPGLNALANHGYISRDGVTSFVEVVAAINQGLSTISCSSDQPVLTCVNSSDGHGYRARSRTGCDGYSLDRKPIVIRSWFLYRRSSYWLGQHPGKSSWSSW